MTRTRKNYPAKLKAKVALSAIREEEPMSALSSRYGVHSSVIHRWKREALASMEEGFQDPARRFGGDPRIQIQELHAKIGQLTVEKDFLEGASKRLGLGGGKKW